jgi:hypothetical protein
MSLHEDVTPQGIETMSRRLAFISMFVFFVLAYATTGQVSRSAVSVLRIGETEVSQDGDSVGMTPAA